MIEQIQTRIDKLSEIGQQAFGGTDYTFGFNTWKSGTLTLLRKLFPKESSLIEQIENINLSRVNHNRTDSSAYNLQACKNEAKEILSVLIETINVQQHVIQNNQENFWTFLHPKVINLAKTRFENELYADSVSACLREINRVQFKITRPIFLICW